MGNKTAIEWCDATFNPWWGCTEVSPACDHCYARNFAHRFGVKWGVDAPRREFGDDHWNEPLKWARTLPAKLGRRPRVFCASMADVFDKDAPEGARERLLKLIEATPELDWLLLTKRIGNVARMAPDGGWGFGANVWLGATIANQEEADRDIPKLLAAPAHVRFLSCEPLLGPLDLTGEYLADKCGGTYPFPRLEREHRTTRLEMLDWVIAGGESGPHARPAHPDWIRSLRDQCDAAGVPFLFKQWGEYAPYARGAIDPKQLVAPDALDGMRRFGKKLAGRVLDGRTHDGYPA